MRPQKWQRAIRQIAGWRPAALARVDSPGLYSARVTTREGRLEAAVVFGFTEGEGWWGGGPGRTLPRRGEGRDGVGGTARGRRPWPGAWHRLRGARRRER